MSDLSALLEREASAEIEGIMSEARERAGALVAEAQAEAERLLAQRGRAAEALREAALVRARSAAQLEAAAVGLQARHAAVAQVFDGARERLVALPRSVRSYRAALRRLLAAAVEAVGVAEVASVRVAPTDVEAVRAASKALKLEVPVEGDESVALGVRVQSKRCSVVENTLLGRLEAMRSLAAADISRLLFEDGGEAAEDRSGGVSEPPPPDPAEEV